MVYRFLSPHHIIVSEGFSAADAGIKLSLSDITILQMVALQPKEYIDDRISIASRLFYAPEVTRGDKKITSVADVWSLGAILYLIVMFDFKLGNFHW